MPQTHLTLVKSEEATLDYLRSVPAHVSEYIAALDEEVAANEREREVFARLGDKQTAAEYDMVNVGLVKARNIALRIFSK